MQQVESRNRALLDAIPDPMFRVARDGTYLDVRADDDVAAACGRPSELIGRNVRDVLPPRARGRRCSRASSARSTSGAMSAIEYELEIAGVAPLEGVADGAERRRTRW